MKIGMQPANSGDQATPELLAEFAETADRLGFDLLQVTDHVVLPVEYSSPYPYDATGRMRVNSDAEYFEPLSLLGFLAGRTTRIRLGTSVLIAPYRNPVVTAKFLACLDVLTGGRLVAGLGVGWMAEEFAAVNAPPFEERGAVTDETIEVFRRIWRDQPASFSGRFFNFAPVGAMPKPVQAGGIPILIGGHSRPAIRRAARLGDGWQPFKRTPDELASEIAYLNEHMERAGRDRAGFTVSLRLGLRLTSGPTERRRSEESWKTLVGTPAQVSEDLEAYRRLGVDDVVFDFRTCSVEETRESLHLAAGALIPQFDKG